MLLGRSRELTRLTDLLVAAREGRSAAVVISGEAGIGKSALAETVASAAADTAILRARGIEAEYAIPFAGLAELFRPAQHLLSELPAPQAAALEGALALGPPIAVEPFAVGAATLSLLAAAAQDGFRLCVVDDAHWLDPSSAQALIFAARRMRAEGSVIIFTVREGEPGAQRFGVLEQLPLAGLDAEPAATLLARGAGRPLPLQVVQRLLTDTGGNPLALLELPGQLTEDQLSGRSPIREPLPINSLLREGFLRQIRTLPQSAQTALLLVATSDLEVTDLVAQALRQAGGSLADLEPAEVLGLVNIGNGRLTFRHPLIRPAVFHAATPAQRRWAHRQLADALDRVAVPQAQERRAWHLAEATVTPDEEVAAALERVGTAASYADAVPALERAAGLSPNPTERARRLLAAAEAAVPAGLVPEAIKLLEQARAWTDDPVAAAVAECEQYRLAVWVSAPEESRARLFAFAARIEDQLPSVAARAYLAAAQASLFGYDIPAITNGAEQAARLAGADEHVALHCDVFTAFAAAQAGAADRAGELLAGRQAQLAVHDTFDNDQLVLSSAGCYLALQRTTQARPLLTRAVDASRAANAVGLLAHQLPWMALLEWLEGDWTAALALAHEAVELAKETGWLAQLPNSLSTLARIEAGFGMEGCREHAEAALAAARSGGHAATTAHALAAVGLLELGRDLSLDQPQDAAEVLQQALDAAGPQAAPNLLLQILPDLVTAYLLAGRREQATETLAQLDELAASAEHFWVQAATARCHGLLEPRNFAKHFEQALHWHDQGNIPFERARTHLAYGFGLRRSRNRAGARVQLKYALELFDRLGAVLWADWTRELLVSSGGSAPARGESLGRKLTPRELTVALAIQRGLSNADAAAELFLSVKTIEYHLSSIFRRLGISSRTQLIRALDQGRLT